MAAAFRQFCRRTISNILQNSKSLKGEKIIGFANEINVKKLLILGCATGIGSAIVVQSVKGNRGILPFSSSAKLQAQSKNEKDSPPSVNKTPVTYRELRFRQFASVEYEGNIYMTPQDFLESVTEETPRARIGRTNLSKSDLDAILRHTPVLNKGTDQLFRKLHDKGLISYTEYLFLLCVLTMSAQTGQLRGKKRRPNEPHSGFRIAFNMFDTDGNQIVDKREFLVLESFFSLPPHERKFVPRDPGQMKKLFDLEKVFSSKSQLSSSSSSTESKPQTTGRSEKKHDQLSQDLSEEIPDTTLLIHFFGKNGKNVLKYKDFHRFMENLQSEVIELEFLEFSKGLNTISEVEFARVLLRYTNLDKGDVDECIDRVRKRVPNEKGITFVEFKKFCQFLNSLDDFAIAMKMYTFANQSVSQEEFQRAVKVCTGYTLGTHIVNTVFQIFDADGDGNLSHKEFISIMKDRLHRGARSHLMHSQNTWESFKTCVKNEMKTF